MAEKLVEKKSSKHNAAVQTDDRKYKQTFAAQTAKGSLSNNGINAKDNVD